VDLGSGKGRTCLWRRSIFRRIVGVEILPELHEVAQEISHAIKTIAECRVLTLLRRCNRLAFPLEPLVLSCSIHCLRQACGGCYLNLDKKSDAHPRRCTCLYHNPLQEHVLNDIAAFQPDSQNPAIFPLRDEEVNSEVDQALGLVIEIHKFVAKARS